MANISKIKLPDGTSYNIIDTTSGYVLQQFGGYTDSTAIYFPKGFHYTSGASEYTWGFPLIPEGNPATIRSNTPFREVGSTTNVTTAHSIYLDGVYSATASLSRSRLYQCSINDSTTEIHTLAYLTDIPTVPTGTNSATTGISISDHSTSSIYGVSSSTTSVYGVSSSTTTASKVTLGTAKSIPNVTGSSDVTVPVKNADATTVPVAANSATACDDITEWAAGSGSASLTFTMDTTDTKKLKIAFSHSHTAPTLNYTARSITGVSGSTSVIGVQSTTTTASKVTLGTAISVPNVTGATDVIVPIKNADATVVPIKNTNATTVVTSGTHSITDAGHTHNL